MLLQEVKEQVFKLPPSDRLALVSAIIESLRDQPVSGAERSGALRRMRGLLKTDLESAFNSGLVDFEDAVQIFGAVAQGLDTILTRDSKGFLSSPIPVRYI